MADNDDVLAVTANTAGKAAFKNEAKNRQQYARPMTDKVSWRSLWLMSVWPIVLMMADGADIKQE